MSTQVSRRQAHQLFSLHSSNYLPSLLPYLGSQLTNSTTTTRTALSQPLYTSNISTTRTYSTTATAATNQTTMKTKTEQWPVVVCGAGPTGLTTAWLLSKYGVPCLVLEKAKQLTNQPQAHFINHRTMEIFRSMDGLASEVYHQTPPLQQWRNFVYCTTMLGDIIGTVDHFKGQSTPHSPFISPEPVAHLSQNRLLPLLAKRVTAQSNVDLRMGHSVQHIQYINSSSTDNGTSTDAILNMGMNSSKANANSSTTATATTTTGDGGVNVLIVENEQGEQYTVESQYVVAADGVRSEIRKQLGIEFEGPGAIQHLLNVYFSSPELGKRLLHTNNPGMLYFVFNANTIAIIVAHDLAKGEFVAQIPYFPPVQSHTTFTTAVCMEILKQAAVIDNNSRDVPIHIKSIRPWTMSANIAERYCKNNVYLVGDAAHVVPPAGAFGMNTGIQDAHNLAWKLAAVVQGQAGEGLLSSYEVERKPVAVANMNLSVANFHEALRVPRMMGLDYEVANTFTNTLSFASFLPTSAQSSVLELAMKVGRAASGVIGRVRRKELESVLQEGETLRLQYPKEDLGFVYGGGGKGGNGAVCYEGDDAKTVAAYTAPKPRSAPFTPALLPGSRIPHFPIKVLQSSDINTYTKTTAMPPDNELLSSSIDIPTITNRQLALLIPANTTATHLWLEAIKEVNKDFSAPCIVPIICSSMTESPSAAENQLLLEDVFVIGDVDNKLPSFVKDWESGVVMVRPDGHVAWKSKAIPKEEVVDGGKLVEMLRRAVKRILFVS